MINLKKTFILLTICTVIVQIAQCADTKCNLDGTKLVCKGINNDELVENLKKYQPTDFVCNECTITKMNLQQLDIETKKKLQKIEVIELLSELDFDLDTFNGVENLNAITFVNATMKALEPELLKPAQKLTEATFVRCDVRKRVERCFQYNQNLKKFTLTNSRLSSINAKWFTDIPNLVELDFSESHIQTIDKDSFKKLPKLEKVILYKNDIKVLPTELFDNQPALKYVDVSHNPIEQIDIKHIIETNKKLDDLLMYDLPCQTFEAKAESLQTDLQFVTECNQEGKDGPYPYKTSCVKLSAYDKRTPAEKLTIFRADGDIASDDNFAGLPCVSNNKAKDVFRP